MTMEKLLHERLREANGLAYNIQKAMGLDPDEDHTWGELFLMIADEIERYYIPLPCDPEGKPWEIGDAGITKSDTDVIVRGYYGGTTLVVEDGNEVRFTLYADELKRPQPKVLDADGEEIKVGQNRYSIRTREYLVVNRVNENRCLCTVLGEDCTLGTCGYEPSDLTNNEPDSLKKLMDDATKHPREYYNDFIGHDVGLRDDEAVNIAVHTHIINRAIAIERGA